jgi:hypothetical protein
LIGANKGFLFGDQSLIFFGSLDSGGEHWLEKRINFRADQA